MWQYYPFNDKWMVGWFNEKGSIEEVACICEREKMAELIANLLNEEEE